MVPVSFSSDDRKSQKKLKAMLMRTFGAKTNSINVFLKGPIRC